MFWRVHCKSKSEEKVFNRARRQTSRSPSWIHIGNKGCCTKRAASCCFFAQLRSSALCTSANHLQHFQHRKGASADHLCSATSSEGLGDGPNDHVPHDQATKWNLCPLSRQVSQLLPGSQVHDLIQELGPDIGQTLQRTRKIVMPKFFEVGPPDPILDLLKVPAIRISTINYGSSEEAASRVEKHLQVSALGRDAGPSGESRVGGSAPGKGTA